MAPIRFRAGWLRDLESSGQMQTALRLSGQQVAEEAKQLGRRVAHSYDTKVVEEDGKVRVEANTDGVNAASWIEFGTGAPSPTPAHAPLRRGAEAAGMKTDRRR